MTGIETSDATGGAEYEEFPLSNARRVVIDYVEAGARRHHIPALLELDVTAALELNHEIKAMSGEVLSFTGWIAKCIAQAISEHRTVHAMRLGKNRLVIFRDVDVSIPVEESLEGAQGPTRTIPMPYLVRAVDKKSVKEIHSEIRAAQMRPVEDRKVYSSPNRSLFRRFLLSMPSPIRRRLIWRKYSDPFFVKKTMGTVALTSVGMFGRGARGSSWGIPIGVHPVVVLLGGIARKPAVVDGGVAPRDFLSMTVLVDHDVVDGAPVARFLSRLRDLVETGYGLQEELAELRGKAGVEAPRASAQ